MRRILSPLKISHFILPLTSLAIVIAWNSHQANAIRSLREEGRELERKITSIATASDQENGSTKLSPKGKSPKFAIDWKQLASSLIGSDADIGILPSIDLEERLASMSREEIIAALDEIEGLDLSDEERDALISEILDPLIEMDPQYALERFGNKIKDDPDGIGSQLSSAMRAWAQKDLAAATAWLDRKIAAGDFDSKTLNGQSDVREEFEAALLESLIEKNPAAAFARLDAIPENQRRDVLEYLPFGELSSEAQKSYADFLRGLIPADERAGSFAHLASELVTDGDFSKVDQFLNSVGANPEERVAAARQTAESVITSLGNKGGVTRQNMHQLRSWLAKQAPGKEDELTGRALGEATQHFGKLKYDEAVKLVLGYHKTSKSDDVLSSFIGSFSRHSNGEKVGPLLQHIRDPELRNKLKQRYQ